MPNTNSWRTAITEVADGRIAYRGRPVESLMGRRSLAGVIWLLLVGEDPNPDQEDALSRSLIAALDHGLAAPSTSAATIVASTRVGQAAAVAAGLIAFAGPAHGGAAEAAGLLLHEIVREYKVGVGGDLDAAADRVVLRESAARRRIPGYGHPVHSVDPRTQPLLAGSSPVRLHRDAAAALERALARSLGRRLPMNADAAVAALLLDSGLPVAAISAVTAIGRTVGLSAHVLEEIQTEKPFRAPAPETITYTGPLIEGGP